MGATKWQPGDRCVRKGKRWLGVGTVERVGKGGVVDVRWETIDSGQHWIGFHSSRDLRSERYHDRNTNDPEASVDIYVPGAGPEAGPA